MQLDEIINKRQSVRKYKDRPIETKKIEACIEAARMAPSASNGQPWKFVVVTEPKLKEQIAAATYDKLITFNKFAHQAPVLVIIVLEPTKKMTQIATRLKKKDWPIMDIGIAAEHFCLKATEQDLGTCMLGWFREKKLKELLKIPQNKSIALVITLGYADDKQREKIRKPKNQILTYNKYE